MLVEELPQQIQHIFIREAVSTPSNENLRGVEQGRVDDWVERSVCAYPHVRAVMHPLSLELERGPVPDVVADVLLIDQDLVDSSSGPGPAEVRSDAPRIEELGDFSLGLPLFDK